mgnify:FL=1
MPWYYGGMFLATLPTMYMYDTCVLCSFTGNDPIYSIINYSIVSILMNLGWAMCQVSHMSLVPSLSFSRSRRDMLNNLRGTLTFIANLCVLVFAAIFFQALSDNKLKFKVLSLTCIALGLVCCLFFVYHIREKPLTEACRKLRKEYKRMLARYHEAGIDVKDDDAILKSFIRGDTESTKSFGTSVGQSMVSIHRDENK